MEGWVGGVDGARGRGCRDGWGMDEYVGCG